MTTIATDGRTMAGESMTTCNGHALALNRKVYRASDGRIFGGCGPATDTGKFKRYMLEGGDRPTLSEDFSALVLNPDGTVDWFDKEFEPVRYSVPAAIGSGGEYAIGAMLAGKTPAEAVALACIADRCSGGAITSLDIEGGE